MSADRNLLFGILALQLDFVEQDQLIAGMHAWVTDKSRPLSDLLEAAGALDAIKRQTLEAVVEQHIRQHDGDPEQSLATLCPSVRIREAILSIDDHELHASLNAAVGASADHDATVSFRFHPKARENERFKILRLHDEGGLGRVFEAEDTELGRKVALKEIKEQYAADANSQARFVQEAEVTGGLEHPGIVPVYGLGKYADGRPFYAMRFVRGASLRSAVREFHRAEWSDRGARTLELRRLLNRLIDVCNTIQYAHERGVLHRDLKPGNIMLGDHGETLVVDWGLAKVQGRPTTIPRSDQNLEPVLQPLSGSSIEPTMLGSAIGSPGYMSPEQVSGQHDEMGTTTGL